jgi:GH25 family lysozyme M1 (1,4-beta-N-acetylmuramidase)
VTDFGIDVSHWNWVKNWNAVGGNNISYVSVKLTQSTQFTDPDADEHVAGARAAGIHVGGYHFADNTDVAAQVRHFADRLTALGLTGPDSMAPMLDMEAASLRSKANPFIAEFIAGLRQAVNVRRIFVYANLDWFRSVLRPVEWLDEDVLLWIARYNGNPGNPGFAHPSLALHQHTDHGKVPGIPGDVDRNATVGAYSLSNLLIGDQQPALVGAFEAAAAPQNMAAAGKPDNSIELSWDAVDGEDISYKLYEDRSPEGVKNATALSTTTSIRGPFTKLRTFRYWVTATSNGSESPISHKASATLPINGDIDANDEDEDDTPAEILNIGTGGSQNHFNVGIGYGKEHSGGAGEHTDIKQSAIVNGFEESPYFMANPAGSAVQFQVFMGGERTSERTKFPRSELRELEANGTTRAAWNAKHGTHTMEGRTRVLHLQPKRPWVTIAQIHDDDDDTLGIKIIGDSTDDLSVAASIHGESPERMAPYALGEEVAWRIEVEDDTCKIFIDGDLKITSTGFSRDSGKTQYFKAGAYPQSSVKDGGKESKTEFCRLELRELKVKHSG